METIVSNCTAVIESIEAISEIPENPPATNDYSIITCAHIQLRPVEELGI